MLHPAHPIHCPRCWFHWDALYAFEDVSFRTHRQLTAALESSFALGEETLTDNALLTLTTANLPSVAIAKTADKKREARQGTDWEFWLRVFNGPWIRYAIQAKKLKHTISNAGRYGLRHPVGSAWQIDNLAWYARQTKAVPLYCLYNGGAGLDAHSPFNDPIEQFGCTIAPFWLAHRIHRKGQTKSYEAFHSAGYAFPWRYLLLAQQDWCSNNDAQVSIVPQKTHVLHRPWIRPAISDDDALSAEHDSDDDDGDESATSDEEAGRFEPSLDATPPPEWFLRDVATRSADADLPDGWRAWYPTHEGLPVLPRRIAVLDVQDDGTSSPPSQQ